MDMMAKAKGRKSIGIAILFFLFILAPAVKTASAADLTAENVITLINQSRAEAGLSSLTANPKLTAAAENKAMDMFEQQYFAHVGPDGRAPEDWIDDAGYNWTNIGENIAYGYNTAETVHTAFMNSQSHKDNILGGSYEHVGVAAISGKYEGGDVIMVVEEFGATNEDERPTYTLVVTNGTGDGSYTIGQTITIKANAPMSGKVFDRWTGDIEYIASVTSATTTVTIPEKSITLIATYKDKTAATYALTVNNGVGSGSFAEGTNVTITANTPASGMVFDKWTGDTAYVSSATSSMVTVTMPARAISLTATYKSTATYTLTVTNGSGDGTYAEGRQVTITANAPASGKVFDKWTGGVAYVADITDSTTTVTMPGTSITVTAAYKDATEETYQLIVSSGSGSASYAEGETVTITANAPASGMIFDRWTGDTSYVSSIYNATTTVTMPAGDIDLAATYKAASATTYTLTVINGIGDGSYASGASATIVANAPATGKLFDKWTGDTGYVADAALIATTVTMPSKNITLTATYKDIAPAKYTLTVKNGSGSGSYAAGTDVIITANAPAEGKVFDEWDGSYSYLSSRILSTVTVTMPAKAITVNATYKDAPPTKYTLTVTNGSGSGSYIAGKDVSIQASSAATGMVFDKWTGDNNYVIDIFDPSTDVTVPEKNISLTAVYKSKASDYEDGTLIRTMDSPKIYVVIGGKKKWISTPEVFEQLGYKWKNIKIISQLDLDSYPDYEDNLIRAVGGYKVYLVVSGIKRHIPSPEVFLNYGFAWGDVKDVEQEVLGKYKDAYLIRASKQQAIYYLKGGVRKIIPNEAIFNSYGDKWEDVQVISQYEMDAYPECNLIRLSGTKDVYLLEGTIKRRVLSEAAFSKYQLDWELVMNVNQAEFNFYTTGAELK
jgi:hypothetical protein